MWIFEKLSVSDCIVMGKKNKIRNEMRRMDVTRFDETKDTSLLMRNFLV